MYDDAGSTADLVERVRNGDQDGWTELIARFQPLVSAITRRHRLSPMDAADVSQTVWLQLVDRLTDLREPRALPGWLSTTTARACLDVIASRRRTTTFDPQTPWPSERIPVQGCGTAGTELDEVLLRAESCQAIQEGLAELTPAQRQLLLLVVADPPVPYKQISRRLGVPIGSIGPTRSRCLAKLSQTRAVRELVGAGTDDTVALSAAA